MGLAQQKLSGGACTLMSKLANKPASLLWKRYILTYS